MSKPIAIDLCCGLGGWTDGLLAEGYDVIGYDIEAHDYGTGSYPGKLVLADITTLHGSAFKDAALIVASPPCQKYSYMAMPWSLGKAKAAAIESDTTGEALRELNLLFDTCFRLQREASEAAGHHIPMVVENVRGAVKWVGPSKWNYGSFYLWGDVPALMPMTLAGTKVPSFRFDGSGKSFQTASVRRTNPGNGTRFTTRDCGTERLEEGVKQGEDWFGKECSSSVLRLYGSKSPQRKAASAMIAKIPFPLSSHIARTYYPKETL